MDIKKLRDLFRYGCLYSIVYKFKCTKSVFFYNNLIYVGFEKITDNLFYFKFVGEDNTLIYLDSSCIQDVVSL